MKTLLASILLFVTFAVQGANFPYIRLNNKTNQISDNGSAMTFNGVAVGTGGGGFAGAVSNSVAVSGLLAVGAGKTNGIAATAAHVDAAINGGSLTVGGLTNTALTASRALVSAADKSVTSSATTAAELATLQGATGNVQAQIDSKYGLPTQTALTHAGTITLSFAAVRTDWDLTLTGSVTFATSNLGQGYSGTVYGRNPQATNCPPTFPSPPWRWQGAGAPLTIPAGKTFSIVLESRGTTDTNVWAAYTESPL